MARVCVIRQLYFPLDPRLKREVDALIDSGHEVDVICLAMPGEPAHERDGKLTVRRFSLTRRRATAVRYLYEYAWFLAASAAVVSFRHLRRRYDLIQVNSIPDTLVFAAVVPRLLGARVLLDLCECMPEFFATRFRTSLDHRGVQFVARMEQLSIRFADLAMTCTVQMREAFINRGASPEKVHVVLNSADEETFNPDRYPPRQRVAGEFVLVCHGSIEERYGIDTAIQAVALLRDEIPGIRLEVYGDGSYLDDLRALAKDLDVEREVVFSGGYVPLEELLCAIAHADAGIVAMKRDAFRDLTLCNKMFDFIVMRRPAIVSRTRSVEDYFDESCFQLFTSGDERDLARAIRELYGSPELGLRLAQRASEVNEAYRWPGQRKIYRSIIDSLLNGKTATVDERGLQTLNG